MVMNKNESDEKDIELTGEDNQDDPELIDIEETSNKKIKKIKIKLKECEAAKLEHLENLQRAKADFFNSKSRLEKQNIINTERAVEKVIISLLPLCDSFDMAFRNKEAWEQADENWKKGVEGIYSNLLNILKQHQVEILNPLGEEFDPNQHEAMSAVDGEKEADTVVEVLQNGYKRNGKIIRPAKVIIQN